jgi:serine/threonine protein kinase
MSPSPKAVMSARGVHFSESTVDADDEEELHSSTKQHSSPPPSEFSLRNVSPTILDSSSFGSNATRGGGGSSSKVLRGNLTRTQKNRDPLLFYEICAVLGVGSMGSVAKVRKRDEAIGGSARKYNQERVRKEARLEACWSLPLVGGFFRDCLRERLEPLVMSPSKEAKEEMSISVHHHHHPDNDDSTAQSADFVYAMKSVHLSRVTDPEFVLELKNEIEILKSLDHRTCVALFSASCCVQCSTRILLTSKCTFSFR